MSKESKACDEGLSFTSKKSGFNIKRWESSKQEASRTIIDGPVHLKPSACVDGVEL
ncbi:hypothetical protein Ancab_022811, partial [Ancistrocladus abbreviatus]